MLERISVWITDVITGDERITEWMIILFIIVCFFATLFIFFTVTNKDSAVPIGYAENQLLLSEI